MTVDEIKILKSKLQNDIYLLLTAFEKETGCICDEITLSHFETTTFAELAANKHTYEICGVNVVVMIGDLLPCDIIH